MKNKEITLPGDFIDDRKGRRLGSGVYVEDDKVFSKVLGVAKIDDDEISVVALSGVYVPRMGDRVVGVVSEVEISGWLVDINSPYMAFLPLAEAVEEFVDARSDLTRYFNINDIIYCAISRSTRSKSTQVSMRDMTARKLHGGTIIKVTPTKIPRIIGKGGSMVNLIKTKTGCSIVTGQNGVVWIRGENKAKAIEAILLIEKDSHTEGLTEKIDKMLS